MNFTPLNHTPLNHTPFKQTHLQFKRKSHVPVMVVLMLLTTISSAFMYLTINQSVKASSGKTVLHAAISLAPSVLIKSTDSSAPATVQPTATSAPSLQSVVQTALTGSRGTYGIAVENLRTGETFYVNEHRVFESASLYKLWVMATTFNEIKTGNLKPDQVLSESISSLNQRFNISSDEAELTSGTATFTVENALEQMVTISNNYAALLLTEKIGYTTIKTFLENHNFKDSSFNQPPKTTAFDIALFLHELYNGELADKAYTDKMVTLLKDQKLNEKLPKLLPNTSIVAHKTGEIDDFSHDAGIVFSKKGDYIIVVLSESSNTSDAVEEIGALSKAVYEYYSH